MERRITKIAQKEKLGEPTIVNGEMEAGKAPKEKITDPAKLREKIEKIDAKIDSLKAKREVLVKQLYELEA
ncbi:hypothetical protein HPP92_028023 [Vanilla planifolia]|uniref:Uncharacterized protein n=1 Tax=Vanilla planifolia TaxID=51239 RepID=A0A835P6U3_VANPL|nr:hypothetical protein HPP92_028023 [Vanilla planifolia]KAG0493059.1 hypothetical protein HPP92_006457 [Vanilla planifolia]